MGRKRSMNDVSELCVLWRHPLPGLVLDIRTIIAQPYEVLTD